MGRDELEEFLRKKGAAELITEIGRGTATFKALVDAVSISSSTVSSRLSEGVEKDVYRVTHAPTEHGTEKRYELTILDVAYTTGQKIQNTCGRFENFAACVMSEIRRLSR